MVDDLGLSDGTAITRLGSCAVVRVEADVCGGRPLRPGEDRSAQASSNAGDTAGPTSMAISARRARARWDRDIPS